MRQHHLAVLIITQPGCKDNCKDNEAPEIEFGLLAGGVVEVRSLQTGYVVTSEWDYAKNDLASGKVTLQ